MSITVIVLQALIATMAPATAQADILSCTSREAALRAQYNDDVDEAIERAHGPRYQKYLDAIDEYFDGATAYPGSGTFLANRSVLVRIEPFWNGRGGSQFLKLCAPYRNGNIWERDLLCIAAPLDRSPDKVRAELGRQLFLTAGYPAISQDAFVRGNLSRECQHRRHYAQSRIEGERNMKLVVGKPYPLIVGRQNQLIVGKTHETLMEAK